MYITGLKLTIKEENDFALVTKKSVNDFFSEFCIYNTLMCY